MSGSRTSVATDGDDVALDVHPDVADLEGHRRQVGLDAAAQHGADAGDQLARRVRLGDVVVGAELEPDHLVDLVVLGADHDHRHVGGLPDLAADLGARDAGQHQVEQHDVGAGAVELRQRIMAGGGDGHLEPLLAEHVGEGIAVALLVLDDQYATHAVSSLMTCDPDAPGSVVLLGSGPGLRGRVRVNVEPWPSTDQTRTSPPWEAATCLTIDRPRPVPPVERWRAGSTR